MRCFEKYGPHGPVIFNLPGGQNKANHQHVHLNTSIWVRRTSASSTDNMYIWKRLFSSMAVYYIDFGVGLLYYSGFLCYWHCWRSRRQGLCNGTVSVRLTVCLSHIDRCNPLRRVRCCGPCRQEISMNSGRCRAPVSRLRKLNTDLSTYNFQHEYITL